MNTHPKSWSVSALGTTGKTSPYGDGKRRGIVSQIYFETAEHSVRGDGVDALDRLASAVRAWTNGQNRRVQVAVVGHADHRGSQPYNHDLGERRAKSVLQTLMRNVGHAAFDGFAIDSRGEDDANQFGNRSELANDRRVDVIDVYSTPHAPFPVRKSDRLCRITKRTFRKSKFERDHFYGKDTVSEAIDAWKDFWYGPGSFAQKDKLGDELIKARHFRGLPVPYRVNRVEFDIKFDLINVRGGFEYRWTTTATYHWGPPSKIGTVIRKENGKIIESMPVLRKNLDRIPLFNPPTADQECSFGEHG